MRWTIKETGIRKVQDLAQALNVDTLVRLCCYSAVTAREIIFRPKSERLHDRI
jgi:hypothetical protein